MPASVQFYFGIGSRYSYLAATQLDRLRAETGATFAWRALYSPDLIARSGTDPFAEATRRGQYRADYRSRDARRWSALYRVPYVEPDWSAVDWRRLALACVAAEGRGCGEAYARRAFSACFGGGAPPPRGTDDLIALGTGLGLDADFGATIDSAETARRHEQNLADALAAGAFGVPSFVTVDGGLFFGQDRLPLLRHHLMAPQQTVAI
jgi:2-hydroxychromene-2-carboxylate isomerase